MAQSLETIAQEALQLPEDQKVTLAHRILASAEPPARPEVDARWEAEIAARIERLDRGETGRHDASEVFAELDKRLGR